ncbi:MAG TPA: pyrimidine reductase family protein [Miltoncostaeaceae bacterium]|nr:pyrimidine reductase family protein [Miltoncostaeaceae bacterium]
MRRLYPDPADPVDPLDVYGDPPTAEGRPGLRVNMIASADGATTVEGRSGGLGGAGDRALFHALRALADVILVGAGTARAEGYGPPKLSDGDVAARERRGQEPHPRIAVVTRSLGLDWGSPLFARPTSRPIVAAPADAPPDRLDRAREVAEVVLAGAGSVNLPGVFAMLGQDGVRTVLCEGGPSLNGLLAAAGLVDELCLTVAPLLTAGDAKRIVRGPVLEPPAEMTLASACEEDGFLFLRYRT